MSEFETGYQPIGSYVDDHDDQEGPPTHIIHPAPSNSRVRWTHIEDLDEFFTRVYQYHQRSGFLCMFVGDLLNILQFSFVVLLALFLASCVDYDTLFYENQTNGTIHKVSFGDAIIPPSQCAAQLPGFLVLILVMAALFVLLRLVQFVYNMFQYYGIGAFYNHALRISGEDLNNMTWHEVQSRLLDVQKEQQMCVHKQELTQLDIYRRILRFKNYMVAMVNKKLLPLPVHIPFVGPHMFFSTGLKYNLEMTLFWGPWSPFESNWHLRQEYKNSRRREELASVLSRRLLLLGVANLLFAPVIFMWQILYSFFRYAEMLKRNPSVLGSRMWSNYARLYCRHFNELDHEFDARLNRAYKPADRYMNIFTSPLLVILAKHTAFFSASILAVYIALTIADEDFLAVEHVIQTMTVLGVLVAVCRAAIPDEHQVYCPEWQMRLVLAQIHYQPDDWKGNAHTQRVRGEFAQLFEYKMVYLLEELLSPIVTPFMILRMRSRALDIVDFLHHFTVEVPGVGDVCSFAEMDVRRHGSPTWRKRGAEETSKYEQTEDGKTELSLMHFAMTNPEWKPPEAGHAYINDMKELAQHEGVMHSRLPYENALLTSSDLGGGYLQYASMQSSMPQQSMMTPLHGFGAAAAPPGEERRGAADVEQGAPPQAGPSQREAAQTLPVRGGVKNAEGPVLLRDGAVCGGSGAGLLTSFRQSYMASSVHGGVGAPTASLAPLQAPEWASRGGGAGGGGLHHYDAEALEMLSHEMSYSAVLMHQMHRRRVLNPTFECVSTDEHERALWQTPPARDDAASPGTECPPDPGASSRERSGSARGRSLPAVTEASFKTADEEGSDTEMQEMNATPEVSTSNDEQRPLLLDAVNKHFNPRS